VFQTIKSCVEAEITEKKSKFICHAYHVESVDEAEEILRNLRKEYHDARHNCFAYRVIKDDVSRASDDGEPSGTAGMPMLNILNGRNLSNILVVVTRYFGGILLGAGPLSRAYLNTAKEAIKNCEKEIIHNYISYNRTLSYSKYQLIKDIIDKRVEEGIVIIDNIEFTDKVKKYSIIYLIVFVLLFIIGCFINIKLNVIITIIPLAFTKLATIIRDFQDTEYIVLPDLITINLLIISEIIVVVIPFFTLILSIVNIPMLPIWLKVTLPLLYFVFMPFISYLEDVLASKNIFELFPKIL